METKTKNTMEFKRWSEKLYTTDEFCVGDQVFHKQNETIASYQEAIRDYKATVKEYEAM